MLEAEAGRKLDVLVSRILYQAEKAFSKEGLDVDSKVVFNILFRFLSAKLLCDREVKTEHKIDFSAPIETLRAVDNYYRSTGLSSARQLSKAVLATIADEVGRAFSFRNISVDTLTYVYENTFVSPERRQSLGIHSTPSYIADYVLSQLPLEELQRDKLQVLDPTCGHGIFLIAAMRRMRTFMPTDWGGHRRHEFFVKHLTGVDIEGFSIEVARLCLMLADFPESNGWNVRCEDVFKPGTLERYARDSTAIVGNPPFEAFSDRSPQTPKPVELLRRLLPNLQQGAM